MLNIVIAVVAVLLLIGGCIWLHSKKSSGTASTPGPAAVPPARGKFPPPAPIKDR